MGYVHIYTGDGKGKTTAALGLLLRAVGAGLHCQVYQFLKYGEYSEVQCIRARFPEVPIEQFGSGAFVDPHAIPLEEFQKAQNGFKKVYEAVCGGAFDLVILDELNVAMDMGLIPIEDVLHLLENRSGRTELVLTGRNAPKAIIDAADLCTEMRMLKHYYQKGVPARRGIES